MPSTPESHGISLAELALQLHFSRESKLTIQVPEGKILNPNEIASVNVENGCVRFASLADINAIVAAHTLAELRTKGPLEADSLFHAGYKLWRCEIGRPDMASGRLLASASEVDVLLMAVERILKGAPVLDVLHQVEAMFLHVERLSVDSLIALNDAQYDLTKRDMAVGMLFNAIENWFASRGVLARELTARLLAGPLQSRENLLGAVWIGWFRSDTNAAAEMVFTVVAQSGTAHATPLATRLAGRMLGTTTLDVNLRKKLEEIINAKLLEKEGSERQAAIQVASQLIHLTNVFDTHLAALADTSNQEALASICFALAAHQVELLEQERFFLWLTKCVSIGSEYKDSLGSIDYGLSSLIVPNGPYLDQVLDFLKAWVIYQPRNGPSSSLFADTFDQCTMQIVNHPGLLSRWVTDWLLSDDSKLSSSVAGALMRISDGGSLGLKFSISILDEIDQDALVFLMRRLLGYIHDADQLLSLALSLLDVKDVEARVLPYMHSLLVDEIGYDYLGSTLEAVKSTVLTNTNVRAKQMLEKIIHDLKVNIEQLEKLPRLNELQPATTLRRQFSLARARQIKGAAKDAEKNSILQHIATRIYIKAGHTSFQYLRNEFTEPMKMQSFSHSIQIPRRESLDPVGNAIRGFQLRNATRNKK